MHFAGFDGWFEIFRGGKQTDSRGLTHDGDTLIKSVLRQFRPGKPKLVIDHPEIEAPALGVVEKLKTEIRNGMTTLLAKAGGVAPELAGLQKKGFFTGRSIGIAADGSLDHVGFLYGYHPAVKGLRGLEFTRPEGALEFYMPDPSAMDCRPAKQCPVGRQSFAAGQGDNETTNEQGGKQMDLGQIRDFLKGLGLKVVPQKDATAPETPPVNGEQFSAADIEAAKKEAAEKAAKKAEAEFAAKEATARAEAQKKEIGGWVKQLIDDGKLPPVMTAGMAEFCEALVDAGAKAPIRFSFGDAGEKKETDPAAWFKHFCEQIPKSHLFTEFAAKERAGGTGDAGDAGWDASLSDKV